MLRGWITLGSDRILTAVQRKFKSLSGTRQFNLISFCLNIDRTPQGLKDTSEYPNWFAELLARGWAETDLEKVAGLNLLRVLRGAEAV